MKMQDKKVWVLLRYQYTLHIYPGFFLAPEHVSTPDTLAHEYARHICTWALKTLARECARPVDMWARFLAQVDFRFIQSELSNRTEIFWLSILQFQICFSFSLEQLCFKTVLLRNSYMLQCVLILVYIFRSLH